MNRVLRNLENFMHFDMILSRFTFDRNSGEIKILSSYSIFSPSTFRAKIWISLIFFVESADEAFSSKINRRTSCGNVNTITWLPWNWHLKFCQPDSDVKIISHPYFYSVTSSELYSRLAVDPMKTRVDEITRAVYSSMLWSPQGLRVTETRRTIECKRCSRWQ